MRARFQQSTRARPARRLAAATGSLALAIAAVGGGSALGAERPADPLTLDPVAPAPGPGPVRDRVIRDREPVAGAAGGGTRTYTDPDGHRIRVQVSGAYSNPHAAARGLVELLGSLPHGDEIDRLVAQIATPSEIRGLCGAGALACYYSHLEHMVVSGEGAGPGEPPRELVIAHEYGHHVARNRRNKPWSGLARGPKRWATHEDICRRIARDRIDPRRYWQNPGEAFAEAYAFQRFPNVIEWQWRIARPDAGAFAAISADVSDPWLRRTPIESSGALSAADSRDSTRLRTPLDGTLKVRLDGPRRADFDLRLLAPRSGRVLAKARSGNADERLRYTVCGRRSVKVVVKRESGGGAFELRTLIP